MNAAEDLGEILTRARVTRSVILVGDLLAADQSTWKRFGRSTKRFSNRRRWRAAIQRRTALIAATLRAVERSLGERYRGRERADSKIWQLYGSDQAGRRLPAVEVKAPPVRTRADFKSALEITVLRPEIVDVAMLERWIRRTGNRR
jgi:hypothetical protein